MPTALFISQIATSQNVCFFVHSASLSSVPLNKSSILLPVFQFFGINTWPSDVHIAAAMFLAICMAVNLLAAMLVQYAYDL